MNTVWKKIWNLSPRSAANSLYSRLVVFRRKPRWYTISQGFLKNIRLYLNPDRFSAWKEMIGGRYDQFLYDALNDSGPLSGKTIWDIGAHFGYHSLAFSRLVGETGSVVSFEPNPHNRNRFQMHREQNEELGRRITIVPCALSDQNGQSVLIVSNDVDGSSSSGSHIKEAIPPLEKESYGSFQSQVVDTFKIDTLLENNTYKRPDIVKIDVEGAELMVLLGGTQLFTKHKPIVFMEVHNIVMMFYVHKFLRESGYELKILDEEHSSTSRCFIIATPISSQRQRNVK